MFNPDIHHRQSIRLRQYDYAAQGAYFVTVCVHERECLFGGISDDVMILNEAGRMVAALWQALPEHYAGVVVDEHVVTPNHFHGIIFLVGAAPRGRPDLPAPNKGHPQGGAPTMSLPDVVHRFKSLTTARYRQGVKENNWPPFPGRLWQRNYYERIIRDEEELTAIREYIAANPMKWKEDKENPGVWVP